MAHPQRNGDCRRALFFFFLMKRPPPRSPLFPYTTLSRSTVGIFQVKEVRRDAEINTAITQREPGGEGEAIGEDGDLVGAPVGVGVFENFDAVAAFLTLDRKSTRLNSSHLVISYAVFCLKK